MEPFVTQVRSSRWDRMRRLALRDDRIEYERRDLIGAAPDVYPATDLAGFRYGVHHLWYLGLRFEIDVRMVSGKRLELRLYTWIWTGLKPAHRNFGNVVNALYDRYFIHHAKHWWKDLHAGLPVMFNDCFLTTEGVTLRPHAPVIPWDHVIVRDYHQYFAIRSAANEKAYRCFDYRTDWNAAVLRALIDAVLDEREEGT